MKPEHPIAADLSQVRALLAPHTEALKSLGVRALAVFGSFARGDQTPTSDIDFLVSLERGAARFDVYTALVKLLQDATGREVDVSTMGSLHPRMFKEYIQEDLQQLIGDADMWATGG